VHFIEKSSIVTAENRNETFFIENTTLSIAGQIVYNFQANE